jgi:hypothetical protein
MSFALALLQVGSEPDRTIIIFLAVMVVACLLVLNLRFFRNLFEIITAPAASLKFHGEQDPFLTSILLVLMGGVIATLIMVANQQKLSQEFNTYADTVASDLAAANGNPNYRDIAKATALDTLNRGFDTHVVKNLLAAPFVFIGLWLFIGIFTFLFSKMLGGTTTAANLLGTTAYSAFFVTIGIGLASVFIIRMIAAQAAAGSATPDGLGIAGLLLILFGVVLFAMGVTQAADLSSGQTIGVLLFLVIVLGGASYGIMNAGTTRFEAFSAKVTTFNPATGKL